MGLGTAKGASEKGAQKNVRSRSLVRSGSALWDAGLSSRGLVIGRRLGGGERAIEEMDELAGSVGDDRDFSLAGRLGWWWAQCQIGRAGKNHR